MLTEQLDGSYPEDDPFDLDIPQSPPLMTSDRRPEQQSDPLVKPELDEEADAAALLAVPPASKPQPDLQDNEEDEKKQDAKPTLKVSYNGFSIFGRSLVVVYVRLSNILEPPT